MADIANVFARLAGLYKEVKGRNATSISPDEVREYYRRYIILQNELKNLLPELYIDLPSREEPADILKSHYTDRVFRLHRDMEYIFEVRANSEIRTKEENIMAEDRPFRVFISHGRSPDWREVQSFIEKDLNISTLELAQEPNKGRTVLQKLSDEAQKCSFAIVVMTGDDEVGSGPPRARENVMHEIGFFQGKYGLENVCLLHEEGTSIPSNIHGLVYIPFPKGLIIASFGVLGRELRSALTKAP